MSARARLARAFAIAALALTALGPVPAAPDSSTAPDSSPPPEGSGARQAPAAPDRAAPSRRKVPDWRKHTDDCAPCVEARYCEWRCGRIGEHYAGKGLPVPDLSACRASCAGAWTLCYECSQAPEEPGGHEDDDGDDRDTDDDRDGDGDRDDRDDADDPNDDE
jgi:hypothetical protein